MFFIVCIKPHMMIDTSSCGFIPPAERQMLTSHFRCLISKDRSSLQDQLIFMMFSQTETAVKPSEHFEQVTSLYFMQDIYYDKCVSATLY